MTAQMLTSSLSGSEREVTVLMTALSSLLSLLPCMLNTALLSSPWVHSVAGRTVVGKTRYESQADLHWTAAQAPA